MDVPQHRRVHKRWIGASERHLVRGQSIGGAVDVEHSVQA